MKRGEVWWAQLEPRSGSEQRGLRPVVIVSHDAFNATESWRSIVVIPMSTSERQARRGPTAVALHVASLARPSVALCHQITTLDRSKLQSCAGGLSVDDLAALEAGIRAALDLRPSSP